MKTTDEWVSEIESHISNLKNRERKTLYLISAEMLQETSKVVEIHFTELGYTVDIRKCNQCTNTFDIIIQWN